MHSFSLVTPKRKLVFDSLVPTEKDKRKCVLACFEKDEILSGGKGITSQQDPGSLTFPSKPSKVTNAGL